MDWDFLEIIVGILTRYSLAKSVTGCVKFTKRVELWIDFWQLENPLVRRAQARFKRRATAVPDSIDRIKFDFSTAVERRLKPSRATALRVARQALTSYTAVARLGFKRRSTAVPRAELGT